MAPLALRDRERGTITLSTSQGLWKKLERIRRHSGVAVAYHAREHSLTDRPGYVLVQGRASAPTKPDRAWLESITPEWERFLGPRKTGITGRMLDVYYWQRVPITIQVERISSFPDNEADGELAWSRAAEPPPQKPPRGGTGPRVDAAKLLAHAQKLPHTLVGWNGEGDMPDVRPARALSASDAGVRLEVGGGPVPEGGRRAGLTSHWFAPRMVGQEQRVHTGWLEASGDEILYAPHTKAGYRLPASNLAFTLGSASLAFRMRKAREAGVAE